MIDVLIPTVGRADRLLDVVGNVLSHTTTAARVVLIAEADDRPTWEVTPVLAATFGDRFTALVNTNAPSYAGAILAGYQHTTAPFVFAGADDLHFHPGWAEAALATMQALPHLRVVGTNDLCNPYVSAGMHATHYLVDRRYLDEVGGTVDEGPGSFLPLCYTHQFTDTEFIATAKARAVFAPCLESVVEHRHWSLGLTPTDATTAKTVEHLAEDEALYDSRRDLWFGLSR